MVIYVAGFTLSECLWAPMPPTFLEIYRKLNQTIALNTNPYVSIHVLRDAGVQVVLANRKNRNKPHLVVAQQVHDHQVVMLHIAAV